MIILNIPTNYIAWCCQTGTWSVLQLNTTDLSLPTQLDCIRREWMALLSKGHLEQKLRCLFLGKMVVPLGWKAPSGLTPLLELFKRGWLLRAPAFSLWIQLVFQAWDFQLSPRTLSQDRAYGLLDGWRIGAVARKIHEHPELLHLDIGEFACVWRWYTVSNIIKLQRHLDISTNSGPQCNLDDTS